MKQDMAKLIDIVASTYEGIALSAGINAGILERLNLETPVDSQTIAKDCGYDPDKVEKWLYFAEQAGFLTAKGGGYLLSQNGFLLTHNSPIKDLTALYNAINFLLKASYDSRETFMSKKSLDQLSEGKISRDYQPNVSDGLSALIVNYFHEHQVRAGDTLLDVGCGSGSFLRLLNQALPDVSLNGVDSNLFAIELGKKDNIRLGLQDRIRLLVGDATSDMSEFVTGSYDWVTAINLFHFIPPENRFQLVEEMVRIAKKGVFMTEVIIELSPVVASSNPLMKLLWNDFTGFFTMKEADELNQKIESCFRKYHVQKIPIMQGTTYLVIIQKHE
jgi:ubiquinone/menaquinone biosynthesis C-methylase UbiE